MSNNSTDQVYLLHNKGQDKILDRNCCELSYISKIVARNIFKNKINIIFTQNHLNITPLISVLLAKDCGSDVLIGLPGPISKNFKPLYNEYKDIYFSLLYRASLFFYRKALWCNGRVSDEETIEKLEVEKKPSHGDPDFKKKYEQYVEKNLKNGGFQTKPKIISIPIKGYLPFQNFENVDLTFKKQSYSLKKFDPELIIMESINERRCSFRSLKNLIEYIDETDKRLILHFSWPYLPNLSRFLEDVKENHPDVGILHMGKVFSKKLHEELDEEKPKNYVLKLTLEGDLWDTIYNYDEKLLEDKIKFVVPNLDYNDMSSAINYDFIIDSGMVRIKDIISNEKSDIRNTEVNILKYPPFLNTFLPPEKMTRFVYDEKRPMYLPLVDTIDRNVVNEELVKHFKGIEKDLKPFCLVDHFKGLKTPKNVRKKTLLQLYLLNKVFDINCDMDLNNVYIANMHPSLGSKSKMNEELKNILFCMKNQVDELQKIIDFENKKVSEITDELERINNFKIQKSKNQYGLKLEIKLNIHINYKRGKFGTGEILTEKTGPTLAEIHVNNGRVRYKKYFDNVEVSEKTEHIELKIEKLEGKKRKKQNYILDYKCLSEFRYLPNREIKKSLLLIPGPIPYHTIKEEKILISQGYDAILSPFKEIIFFSYPGYNFLRVINQLRSFSELLTNEKSELYNKDLAYSIENTNLKTKRKIFSKIEYDTEIKEKGSDTHLDNIVRKDILERDEIEDEVGKEKLEELFEKITSAEGKNKGVSEYPTTPIDYSNQISLKVEFGDGTKENVKFSEGTLIRKYESGKYELCPIEEITPCNDILYVANRKTIDNELLEQFFSHVDYDLENILAPLTNLRTFYEELKQTDFYGGLGWGTCSVKVRNKPKEDIDMKTFQSLKWLSKSEKENLYYLLKCGFDNDYDKFKEYFSNDENIWKEYITIDKLWGLVSNKNKVSKGLLASIAKNLGLTLAESTFTQYISIIKDQKHYYFEDLINVKVIGKLIGNKKIIENYQTINNHGKEISNVLIRIGRSISRVTSGNKRMGNEMDLYVSKYLKKCHVKEVNK